MKKLLASCLIIVLTLMSVIAMYAFKTGDTVETSKIPDETLQYENRPEGTGLIFDDNDQNINIQYNPVHKNDTKK